MPLKDGDWELMDWQPATGRTVWRCFDGAATHYRTDYPVDAVADANAAARTASAGARFGDGRRVASIPLNIFLDELAEAQSQGDDRYVARWLDDADRRAFKTFEGRRR